MISVTSQQFKHLSEKERGVSKKSNIDTTIDFVKYPKYSRNNPFLKTIPKNNLEQENHNARCSNDRTRRETQDKNVLPNFKVFEKIKQVSSTKLTNWYKNISR